MKKIYLIDWNALIYRMFFALPDFTNKDWKQVNAIFWVAKFFIQELVSKNPDYVIFLRDAKWENFRHEIYSEYKATRERMPDNLKSQLQDIDEMIEKFWVKVIEKTWFEADDIIATLSTKFWQDKDNEIYILSWDKDLYSLVRENVFIYDTIKKEIFDIEKTREKFGVEPEKIIDYLAIIWDTSDNIPWIDWFWPKKAISLINSLWTVEEIFEVVDKINWWENIDEFDFSDETKKVLSWKTFEKIRDAREIAFLSKKLATIEKQVDLWDFHIDDFIFHKEKLINDNTIELFKKYEFNSLLWEQHKIVLKEWKDLNLSVNIIWDDEMLFDLQEKLKDKKEIVFDTETTSLDIIKAELVWVSVLLDKDNIFYINVLHNWPKVSVLKLVKFFKFILNWNFKIIWHNIKYDLEIVELFIKKNEYWSNIENDFKINTSNNFWQMTLSL